MEAFEIAKLALKKHLLENKEAVIADLKAMRKASEGKDIFNYVEALSESFSFENVTTSTEVIFDYDFEEIDFYDLKEDSLLTQLYSPPDIEFKKNKKRAPKLSESSFF